MNTGSAKILTKVAVTYHPPAFKFEYSRGQARAKFHKKINLIDFVKSNMNVACSREDPVSSSILVMEPSAITEALINQYNELLQISPSKIEGLIEKLLSVNPTFARAQSRRPHQDMPLQISMSISKGYLPVTPLLERPKSRRQITKEASELSSATQEQLNRFGNLNQASEEELAAAKDEMNKVFEKCRVLPDDDEYVYDKRIDFEPDEESSWD